MTANKPFSDKFVKPYEQETLESGLHNQYEQEAPESMKAFKGQLNN